MHVCMCMCVFEYVFVLCVSARVCERVCVLTNFNKVKQDYHLQN